MVVALRAANVHAKENDAGVVRQSIEVFHTRLQKLIGTGRWIGREQIAKDSVPRAIFGDGWTKVLQQIAVALHEHGVQFVGVVPRKGGRRDQAIDHGGTLVGVRRSDKPFRLVGRWDSPYEIERRAPEQVRIVSLQSRSNTRVFQLQIDVVINNSVDLGVRGCQLDFGRNRRGCDENAKNGRDDSQ
jgi:hypothetical protein